MAIAPRNTAPVKTENDDAEELEDDEDVATPAPKKAKKEAAPVEAPAAETEAAAQ